MFRNWRLVHRWVGVVNALFLMVLAFTGFMLAIKKRAAWLQPPTQKGAQMASMAEVAPLDQVAAAVFAVGIPQLDAPDEIDRFELHVSKNVFKVTSTEGFHEVQVDAKTAKVLSIGRRNDSFMEQIHDMSFVSPWLHDWVLPAVAVSLFLLGGTGVYMFFVPVWRRWVYRRTQRSQGHLEV